jgi:hypothetical protein
MIDDMTASERKDRPLARGVLDYFPDALLEVAYVSKVGNDQHNPGEPMHWAKEKSTDEADALMRHLVQRGTIDSDGMRHSAKVAWRALALLQRELDEAKVTASGYAVIPSKTGGVAGYVKVLEPNDPRLTGETRPMRMLPEQFREEPSADNGELPKPQDDFGRYIYK